MTEILPGRLIRSTSVNELWRCVGLLPTGMWVVPLFDRKPSPGDPLGITKGMLGWVPKSPDYGFLGWWAVVEKSIGPYR